MKKTIHMIGNAHLDPVWLWQWQEGYQEIKATFQSALDRMDEREDFKFTCACAGYYEWVEENEPEMFEEICRRVKEGRWGIVGGMWIQPDMNTPSGECLARHFLYSQRYFKEKFGVTVDVCYNVDTFGHNGMTPQILKRSGVEHYVWMRPSMQENPNVPEGTLLWEGLDGTQISTFRIPNSYACAERVDKKIEQSFGLSERLGQDMMCFYGVGNHGGGPTKTALCEIEDYQKQGPRGDEVVHSTPRDFFAQMEGKELPIWKGELQHHASGCYSTHSSSKMLHREAENTLLRMEKLGVLARKLTGHKPRAVFVQQGWKNVMFNEFHDIMGGCSIPEALREAEVQLCEAISIAEREENAALQRMSWKVNTIKGLPKWERSKEADWSLWGMEGAGTPVVVFNPHGFEAEGDILVRRPLLAVKDDEGNEVPVQVIRATRTNGGSRNGNSDKYDSIFRAKVPALGFKLFWIYLGHENKQNPSLKVSQTKLENDKICAEFDPYTGALWRLVDKRTGREVLSAPARIRLMDIEHADTWAHMIFKFDQPAGAFSDAKISVIEEGPIRAGVKVVSRFGDSIAEQKYYLHADGDQLDVEMKLNLREKHRLIKLCFPTNGTHDVAEIPYGVIERTGNGDEESCQRWTAVQGENGGLAVLNNGKHSYSAPNGELRLTVANTSIYADHYGQEARDDECIYMDQGEMSFKYAIVPYTGSWKQAGLNRRAAVLQQPLQQVVETYHDGPLGSEYCGIRIDSEHVDIGAFKRAEDDAGYVLRLSETVGDAAKVNVDLPVVERKLELEFGPFEIKTLYLPDDAARPAYEVLISELEA